MFEKVVLHAERLVGSRIHYIDRCTSLTQTYRRDIAEKYLYATEPENPLYQQPRGQARLPLQEICRRRMSMPAEGNWGLVDHVSRANALV